MTDRLHLINKLSGKEANELKLRMIDGEFINEEIIENLKYWLSLSNIDAELECLYGSALPHQECKGHCQAGSDPHLCLPFFPGLNPKRKRGQGSCPCDAYNIDYIRKRLLSIINQWETEQMLLVRKVVS